MNEHDAVRVRVRVRLRVPVEGGVPAAEALWATPMDADMGAGGAGGAGGAAGGAGCYRLQNHAFLAALAAGDVVRAEPDGSGDLQVVDVVQPAPAVLTLVGRVWDAQLDLEAAMERWRAAGARWTEGSAGALATVWADGMSPQDVLEVMRPELTAGTLELLEVALPEHRTREALAEDVLFDLDGSAPPL